MPFYEFRSYVGTSGIIRESDQNPTTLIKHGYLTNSEERSEDGDDESDKHL